MKIIADPEVRKPRSPLRDTFTVSGAHAIADEVRDYWIARGYAGIKTWVEEYRSKTSHGTICCVRSNIGAGGVPPS